MTDEMRATMVARLREKAKTLRLISRMQLNNKTARLLDEAADALAEPPEARTWQPFTLGTMLEDNKAYLIYHPHWGREVERFEIKGTYSGFRWRDREKPEPTHYAPLPDPPASAPTEKE